MILVLMQMKVSYTMKTIITIISYLNKNKIILFKLSNRKDIYE